MNGSRAPRTFHSFSTWSMPSREVSQWFVYLKRSITTHHTTVYLSSTWSICCHERFLNEKITLTLSNHPPYNLPFLFYMKYAAMWGFSMKFFTLTLRNHPPYNLPFLLYMKYAIVRGFSMKIFILTPSLSATYIYRPVKKTCICWMWTGCDDSFNLFCFSDNTRLSFGVASVSMSVPLRPSLG